MERFLILTRQAGGASLRLHQILQPLGRAEIVVDSPPGASAEHAGFPSIWIRDEDARGFGGIASQDMPWINAWARALCHVSLTLSDDDAVWFVEDDVAADAVSFQALVRDTVAAGVDLAGIDLRTKTQDPTWGMWWQGAEHFADPCRGFLPLCRLSARLLRKIFDFQGAHGRCVFLEILFPSIARENGMSWLDWNMDSNLGRYFGIFHYRPEVTWPVRGVSHPVKDETVHKAICEMPERRCEPAGAGDLRDWLTAVARTRRQCNARDTGACKNEPSSRPVNPTTARIFFAICSSSAHVGRRRTLRGTWLAEAGEGFEWRFFTGGVEPCLEEADLVSCARVELASPSPQDLVDVFRRALELSEFEWLCKVDDDTYLSPEGILELLREAEAGGHDLVGDSSLSEWGMPEAGSVYLLSRNLVKAVVGDSRIPERGEPDLIVGHAAWKLSARPLATAKLRLNLERNRFPGLGNDLVTACGCSQDRLRTLHAIAREEVREIEVSHPQWRDDILLCAGGLFARRGTGDSGKWETCDDGRILLRWFDWPFELLVENPRGERGFASYLVVKPARRELLASPGRCAVSGADEGASPKPRILVGICSARCHPERRDAVRETWLTQSVENIECRFFVGRGESLASEADTVVLDAHDGYAELPEKVRAFFVWALQNSDFEWLYKCDDDTYVVLERLAALAEEGYDLIADETQALRGAPSGGAGYVLSRRMVERLAADDRLPRTGAEDLIFGYAAVAHGARVKVTGKLYGHPDRFPRFTNNLVTSHPCPPGRLRAIHSLFWGEHETVSVNHPMWGSDEVDLGSDGFFARRKTGCDGRWSMKEDGGLKLCWTKWGEETFFPVRQPTEDGRAVDARTWWRAQDVRCRHVEVKLLGGIGNQMFQYAHGLALARRIGADLHVRNCERHRRYGLDLFGVSPVSQGHIGRPTEDFVYDGGYRPGAELLALDAALRTESDVLTVSGYFQNERFFLPVLEEIRGIFRVAPQLPVDPQGKPPVCVQVRRGDFVGSSRHDVCRQGYYERAMERMRVMIGPCCFVVVSDDPAWCRSRFEGRPDVVVAPAQSEREALATMIASKALIISNSSFGWWGAWMAGNVPVIAPDRFLSNEDWEICPDRWIRMPAGGEAC